jgi:hypothetical protein
LSIVTAKSAENGRARLGREFTQVVRRLAYDPIRIDELEPALGLAIGGKNLQQIAAVCIT